MIMMGDMPREIVREAGGAVKLESATHLRHHASRGIGLVVLRRPAIGLGAGTAHQHRPFTLA